MAKKFIPVKRCKKCGKPLRDFNKSGICTNCNRIILQKKKKVRKIYDNVWKEKYEKLRKEFERYKELSDCIILGYYKELKKLKPDIKWEDENY